MCGDDCDDEAPWRHPGAEELCDERDQDCDGAIDEGIAPAKQPGIVDCDGDGFGDPSRGSIPCRASGDFGPLVCPGGWWAYYEPQVDCDDDDASIRPSWQEYACDGRDEDCDGSIDRTHRDEDGDGYDTFVCDGTADCDDSLPDVHPGAAEICNVLDDDCDPATPRGDADGDGHVAIGATCVGDLLPRDDCDDGSFYVSPARFESCNGRDDDCDGTIDDVDAASSCADFRAASVACVSGRCTHLTCAEGWAQCGGSTTCTTAIATDELHCGSCAGRCASSACVAGACQPFADLSLTSFFTNVLLASGELEVVTGAGVSPAYVGRPVTRIGGGVRLCYRTLDGELGCRTGAPATPVAVPPLAVIHTSERHGCALVEDGRVLCWGLGSSGEIGDGVVRGSTSVAPTPVLGLDDARALAVGGEFTNGFACAIRATGRVVCWGRGEHGVLGVADRANRLEPAEAMLAPDAIAIAAGTRHVCAIDDGGGVWCWGDDDYGQVGIGGAPAIHDTPQRVAIHDAIAIAAGGLRTCAIRASGDLLCWGHNANGGVGDGTRVDRWAPVHVADGVSRVLVSTTHSCLVRPGGAVECWGSNGSGGGLGDGTSMDALFPSPLDWTP